MTNEAHTGDSEGERNRRMTLDEAYEAMKGIFPGWETAGLSVYVSRNHFVYENGGVIDCEIWSAKIGNSWIMNTENKESLSFGSAEALIAAARLQDRHERNA